MSVATAVQRFLEAMAGQVRSGPRERTPACPVCDGLVEADAADDGQWAIHELHHLQAVLTAAATKAQGAHREAVRLLGLVVLQAGGDVTVPHSLVVSADLDDLAVYTSEPADPLDLGIRLRVRPGRPQGPG